VKPPATPTAADVIEMRDVALGSMRDLSVPVAEQINWTVARGDYWVIAGLQGSGKSDLMMMTAGLMGPVKGSYRLLGEEMPIFDEARLQHRLRLGFVFDGGQLINHLTVRQNIALPLRYHRNLSAAEAEPFVSQMLDATALAPWADSTPGALARHWHRRVGLARALMLRPQVLLLDNPLGGLDLLHAGWWLTFLDHLAAGASELGMAPVTLVATTSDLRPWRTRAKQFALLKSGHLSVLGNWEQAEAVSAELLRELLPAELKG
jgi:phospholipid/cholesterol/gamma-HCH transport system ATP-binding protein